MKKTIGTILLVMSLGLPGFAVAAGTLPSAPVSVGKTISNPLKSDLDTFPKFVAKVTETAVKVLMPFVVLAFIYSGFLFIKAQGNEEGLTEAKSAIYWSVIGAFILMGAWGFAQIIGETISTITTP